MCMTQIQEIKAVVEKNVIKEALLKKLEGDIIVAETDLKIFLTKPVAVAEHIDYITTAERKLEALTTARDKLNTLTWVHLGAVKGLKSEI